jgi:hypothetical protein
MLVQNLVTGCTVLGNHSLLLQGLPIPEEALMHDFWLGLVAAAFGLLVPLDETTVGYRQHEQNANGAGAGLQIGDAFKRLLGDPLFTQGIARSRRQARKFEERYANQLSRQQKEILQAWSRSKDLPAGLRQWILYRNGLRRTRFLNNLAFLGNLWDSKSIRSGAPQKSRLKSRPHAVQDYAAPEFLSEETKRPSPYKPNGNRS